MKRSGRLDYKKLNTTGEKVEKEEESNNQAAQLSDVCQLSNLFGGILLSDTLPLEGNMEENQKVDQLTIDEVTLAADLEDYLGENDVEESLDLTEVNGKVQRLEVIRTNYRRKHNELKILLGSKYDEIYAESYEQHLKMVKSYILKTNIVKKEIFKKNQ